MGRVMKIFCSNHPLSNPPPSRGRELKVVPVARPRELQFKQTKKLSA
jgi:hypothetical protein